MKALILSVLGLIFTTGDCSTSKLHERLVIIMLENDRGEILKSVRYVNSKAPRLIAFNIHLECEDTEIDRALQEELSRADSLVFPAELLPFGTGKFRDIIGCSTICPEDVTTGFVNLLSSNPENTIIDKVQLRNSDGRRETFHFAKHIAAALDAKKTEKFIKSHSDTISIDFVRDRKFGIYHINDFLEGRADTLMLRNKIVILCIFPYEYFTKQKSLDKQEMSHMSSSEICANIACQLIGE